MILTPEHPAIARVEQLAADLRASAAARDEGAPFARDAFARMGEAGLFEDAVSTRSNALGSMCATLYGLALESQDLGFCASLCAHLCAVRALHDFDREGHHTSHLEQMLSGESLAAVANSEPDAGTNLLGMKMEATCCDDGVLITGNKWNITNVGEANVHLVSARVSSAPASKAISIFVVPRQKRGCATSTIEDLIGLRTSVTGNLRLDRVQLDANARLGQGGEGVAIFSQQFDYERLFTSTLYLAALDITLARGLEHASNRVQFGRPIIDNQYVQQILVDARVARDLLASHIHALLDMWDASSATRRGSLSVLKIYGLTRAIASCQEVIGLLGGRGLRQDEVLTRLMRDLTTLGALGGTKELHKMILHRNNIKAWGTR